MTAEVTELTKEQREELAEIAEQCSAFNIDCVARGVFRNTTISLPALLSGAYLAVGSLAALTDPSKAEVASVARDVISSVLAPSLDAREATPADAARQFILGATAGPGDALCVAELTLAYLASTGRDPRQASVPEHVRVAARGIVEAFAAVRARLPPEKQ